MLACVLVTQSCLTLCDPLNCSPKAPLVMGFSKQEYWSGSPFPSPGDLPNPGIEPTSLMSPSWTDGFFTTSAPSVLICTSVFLSENPTLCGQDNWLSPRSFQEQCQCWDTHHKCSLDRQQRPPH